MRTRLNAIIEQLYSLKKRNVSAVYIADDTLRELKSALSISNENAHPPTDLLSRASAKKSIPSNLRSATLDSNPLLNKDAAPVKKSQTTASVAVSAYSTMATDQSIPEPPVFDLPQGNKKEQMDWLREKVFNCPVCRTHVRPKKKIVLGVGSLDAAIFFCGEAPGADEETKGEPFVGPAGQLLTRIIEAMGLKRQEVYIGNIMNWRPETPHFIGNRPPTQKEMDFCLPYLKAQLAIVQPKVIVALGATAVSGLLGHDPDRKMGKIRGTWQDFEGVPLMITYHPSYILRNGSSKVKRTVWEDMMAVMERLDMPISEKQRGYFV